MQSTLPQTAPAMAATAGQLRDSVAEFARSAAALSNSYKGAVVDPVRQSRALSLACPLRQQRRGGQRRNYPACFSASCDGRCTCW